MLKSSDGVAALVTKETRAFLKEAKSAKRLSEYPSQPAQDVRGSFLYGRSRAEAVLMVAVWVSRSV
jgi:hypothetical protein